ncbi:hypothetical protein [Brevibacillus borstelensis]|uniref:hypothetical protein n=1 Tax=Brevibacillus borstelensis TaxID=45462 RepID=UPI00287FED0E|nr:hypothetical protein [Brevibacillus borstelensis]WNF07261.1 hypothetical protein RFB14_07485 [Brevibacillus borstelensis]
MRIFSKKAFKFDHPAGQESAVIVRSNDFATVPDWVKDSAMFKLASTVGDVSIIETKQDEKAAESDAENKAQRGRKKADDADGENQ